MLIAAATAAASAAAVAGTMAVQARRRKAAAIESARRAEAERLQALDGQTIAEVDRALERAEALRGRLERQLAEHEEALAADEQRLERLAASVERRDDRIGQRAEAITERSSALKDRRETIRALSDEIDQLDDRILATMEEVAGAPRPTLIDQIGAEMKAEVKVAATKAARALEERATHHAETEARRLIDLALYRYGTPLTADRLVATVDLPRSTTARERMLADDRAIIRAITAFSEVEFIEQTDRDGLYMQAPDPFTREIGRLAFNRLGKSKKLSLDRVESTVEKARKDLEKIAQDAGNRAARILRLKKVHPEILFLVGKLLYRTSYTQNQWTHAIETAHLCGIMAEDLGLDRRTAYRSALMHDIGKVLWAETEATGSHAVSGAAFATAHGESPEIVHPIAAHHNDEKPSTPLAHLVAAADALSGARPGARRETIESYTRRVDEVEAICADFKPRGIKSAYVISGGREVRVIVDPRRVDDLAAARLSMDIARRIEDDCIYPGQIKVVVVRETTAQAVARR